MKHWIEALKAELARPEYAGLSADDAYKLLTERKAQVSANAAQQI